MLHDRRARALAWLIGALLCAAYLGVRAAEPSGVFMFDFRPYHCAGAIVARGGDPYREEPLRSCEVATTVGRAVAAPLPGGAVPAPLPPYALAAFSPLGRLGFGAAALVWASLLAASALATVAAVARLARLSPWTVAAAFAPIGFLFALPLGQPALPALAALVAAAAALRACKPVLASAALCAALVEPHVAIVSALTVAIGFRQTRLPLAAGMALCAGLSIAAVGVPTALEYVRAVLPAHALAGTFDGMNLGATAIAAFAGVAPPVAVAIGTAVSLVMLALGAIVGLRLARAFDDPALLALVPAAFAVVGGVHVHVQQVLWAFPAWLLIAGRVPRARLPIVVAFAVAMVPWSQLARPETLCVAVVCIGILARTLLAGRRWIALALVPVGVAAVAVAVAAWSPSGVPYLAHPYPAGSLAEVSWADYLAQIFVRHDWLRLWLRVPTWTGVAIVAATLVSVALTSARHADEGWRERVAAADVPSRTPFVAEHSRA
ncbi:MAG: hypothetical protein JWO85_2521 [Candidatus Eremiobacteraeota bacterium]|nr:hypothetical protein [Candidatus Eremiobacteraeota bacterium]